MFRKEDLHKLSSADGFTTWLYRAGDRADAEAARNLLGYFPKGSIAPGDVVYITSENCTSNHWAQENPHDGQLAVWLFGG